MDQHDPYDIDAQAERSDAAKAEAVKQLGYEIADLTWIMSSKRGRRFMWRQLTNAGVYQLSYTPGDALATAFKEGQRNQGNRTLALLMAHVSEAYGLMVQERNNG